MSDFHYASTSFWHRGCGNPPGGWRPRGQKKNKKKTNTQKSEGDEKDKKASVDRRPRKRKSKKDAFKDENQFGISFD